MFRMLMAATALFLIDAAVANAQVEFVVDGNIAGDGAEWTDNLIVVNDNNDERITSGGGVEFDDHEDINIIHVWFDMDQDKVYWTLGLWAQFYPNAQWAYAEGMRNRSHPSIAFDVDNDQETGALTDKNHHGGLTFAYPLIGFDLSIQTSFDDKSDGSHFERGKEVNGRYNLPVGTDLDFIEFVLGYDGDGGVEGGPNANWLEASAELSGLRDIIFATDQSQAFQKGDIVGVAGIIESPVPLGEWGEEITDAGYIMLGWGPVDWDEDTMTREIDAEGTIVVPSGETITYDKVTKQFTVGATTYDASPLDGAVAVSSSTWGSVKSLYR